MIQPGDIVQGRYLVKRELGKDKGAFGKVFEVEDLYLSNNNHKVFKVLKALKLSNFKEEQKLKLTELFMRSARVLKRMNHSGIPKVDEDGYFQCKSSHTQEFLPCLVMEKIEGQDLGEYLKDSQNPAISQPQAVNCLKQLLEILKEIHPDFVHRDIKPDNIMLKPDNQLVLIDFGAVKALGNTYVAMRQNSSRTAIGTPGYIPPEQQWGEPVRTQSDFFALGRTFVHLLTKKDPFQFELDTNNQLIWREQAPQVSDSFADLIDWMMEYHWEKRPQDTEEILRELSAISKSQSLPDNRLSLLASGGSIALNLFLLREVNQAGLISDGLFLFFFIIVIVLTICLFFPKIYKALNKMVK